MMSMQSPYALLGLLLILGASSAPLVLSPPSPAVSSSGAPPAASLLQSGDLLWPKRPNAIVPYNSRIGGAGEQDKRGWLKERDAYLALLRARPTLTPLEKDRIGELRGMSYERFLALYVDGEELPDVIQMSGTVGTGHVAIVRVRDSGVTIVEAMFTPGVREISYDEWRRQRAGEYVWHGRLANSAPDKRAAVADIAAGYVGKPYKFWNFDLSDESGFYCSKLAWLSILRATGVAIDGNRDPQRRLWFSPKQLLRSAGIDVLQNPGNYGR